MPQSIPVEIVFNPNWWFRNYGISFDRPFYFDPDVRIANDVAMRRALYERYGFGAPDPQPRPVIGSRHVAGGFLVPALLGVEIRFEHHQAPWNVPRNLSPAEVRALRLPDLATTWPMNEIASQVEQLRSRFGYVTGDWNLGGLINTAMEIRGNDLFTDFTDEPDLVDGLLGLIAELEARLAATFRAWTGTNSVSCNRGILHAGPAIFLEANCSVQMISPRHYDRFFLPRQLDLARRLRPYGIHHCGNNTQLYKGYRQLGLAFLDVGWGSDAGLVREAMPDTYLNLRLSPVRMMSESAETIRRDVLDLLSAGFKPGRTGVCCINMDYGTRDDNVLMLFETVREFAASHSNPE